jgi:hypothetical protein
MCLGFVHPVEAARDTYGYDVPAIAVTVLSIDSAL